MGTDSIKLFNKSLADQILAMGREELVRFLEENIGSLQQKLSLLNLVLFEMKKNGGSVSDSVECLLSGEQTFTQLSADVAQDFAFGDAEIYLDYWGCYAHVFDGHPESSISSLNYLPDQDEETFLLLRPEHLDQMIESLRKHVNDLSVMMKRDIETLEQWRNFCVADPRYMVAYQFDY
jgi:hypothetical protein